MNEKMKQKWTGHARNGAIAFICGLVLLAAPQLATADSLSGTTLSGAGSAGGFFFAPGTTAGDLSMTITSCPGSQLSGGCLPDAGITGSTNIGGTAFTWQILPSSSNFTPCTGTSDCWNFGSTSTGTPDWLIQPPGGLNQLASGGGLISWSSITDANGLITLSGTATGTDPTGASVDDPFSVTLGTLSCTDANGNAVTPCSLSAVADSDPIYGTASFSSGEFGSSSGSTATTPEPSSWILFGLGVFFLAGAAATKRAWATQQNHA
jgi:hypothetical protein